MNRYLLRNENFGGLLYDRENIQTYLFNKKRFKSVLEKNPPNTEIVLNDCVNCSTLNAPTRVFLILTNRCNLNCIYCSNYSDTNKIEKLTFEEVSLLLHEFKKMGVFEISLGGGEPLCHPDFFKIVKLAKKLGFVILMNSNGIYTNEQKKFLVESGIDKIKISIDGVGEKNDILRGKNSFKQAWSSVKYLKEKGKRVKINCTLLRKNFDGAFELSKLCNDNGISLKIAPMYYVGRGRFIKEKPILLTEIIDLKDKINKYCKEKQIENLTNIASALFGQISGEKGEFVEKHIECCINRMHMSVNMDGNVIPTGCQTCFNKYMAMGNIKSENCLDIWKKIQVYNDKKKESTKECRECDIVKKFGNYFIITNEFHGEVRENEKSKIIF